MKKILALVLSLCMLLSCTAFAEGISGRIKIDVQGQTQVEGSFTVAQDEDGCIQLSVDGTAGIDTLNTFVQIASDALVIGSEGEYMQINYEDLLAALQTALPQALTEEQMQVVGLIYYAFTGLEGDLEIVSSVLGNELMRLINIGMQLGVISYSGDSIVFEADQDQLLDLFKAYLANLAEDTTALEALSGTQIWNLLGLSENAVNEKQYLAMMNQQIAALELPGTFTLYIKAVIAMSGGLTLDVDYTTIDGENTLNLDVAAGEGALDVALVALLDGTNVDANISAAMTEESIALEGSLKLESAYSNLDLAATLDADCDAKEIAYNVDAVLTEYGYTTTMNSNFTFDKTNGLYFGFESVGPDGIKNALYLNANAQTDEYGAQANLSLEAIVKGEPLEVCELNAVVSDALTVHAELNSLRSDTKVQHTEGSSFYWVSYNDLLFGYQNEFPSESEYSEKADSYTDGAYNVFTFDCKLNMENAKLDAEIDYGGQSVAIDGTLSADAYTVIVNVNGMVLATAVQQLLPGQDFGTSLLMGELTITLYDGTVINRTTVIGGNGVSWLFTVTSGGQSQQAEIGIRDKSAGNRKNYELFLAIGGIEYDLGIVFEQSTDNIFAELYVDQADEASVINYLDATLELQPITETPAHVSGQVLPQSYLEQLLIGLLSEFSGLNGLF